MNWRNLPSRVGHLATTFMVISYLAYISTLRIELIYSSDTSAEFLWAALRYIPEDIALHSHHCENLNPNFVKNVGTWGLEWEPCSPSLQTFHHHRCKSPCQLLWGALIVSSFILLLRHYCLRQIPMERTSHIKSETPKSVSGPSTPDRYFSFQC
jgi:hypothetical protein